MIHETGSTDDSIIDAFASITIAIKWWQRLAQLLLLRGHGRFKVG
jgi:hypothetical protein